MAKRAKIGSAVITVVVLPSKVDPKYIMTHFKDEETET